MKKSIYIIALLAIMATITPFETATAIDCYHDPIYDHEWSGEITTGAFVRNNACMEGTDILTTLPVGTKINVTGETDGWYRVRTNEIDEGWIGQWLISVTDKNNFTQLTQTKSQTSSQIQAHERNRERILEKTRGRILLQVEKHGEAWYVDPVSEKRFYMENGPIAYEMMRKFGLGITDEDLLKLQNGDDELARRLKGRILLQVQKHGEAYYVHPETGIPYYMKDGDTAYELMRNYSLGITDADLEMLESEIFEALN